MHHAFHHSQPLSLTCVHPLSYLCTSPLLCASPHPTPHTEDMIPPLLCAVCEEALATKDTPTLEHLGAALAPHPTLVATLLQHVLFHDETLDDSDTSFNTEVTSVNTSINLVPFLRAVGGALRHPSCMETITNVALLLLRHVGSLPPLASLPSEGGHVQSEAVLRYVMCMWCYVVLFIFCVLLATCMQRLQYTRHTTTTQSCSGMLPLLYTTIHTTTIIHTNIIILTVMYTSRAGFTCS